MEESTMITRRFEWRVRLLAAGMARYLDAHPPHGAPLGVRRARLAAATKRARRFTYQVERDDDRWVDESWKAHRRVHEAFRLDDGVPFMARFPLPTA